MQTKQMQEYKEKASKNEVFMEVKFDMAMQSFLERRGHENFAVECMEQDDNAEFDFIQITHISYDRKRDFNDINLIDFQQILSAAASRGGKFAYLIDSDSQGIRLYLGISKIDKGKNEKANFLQETFHGIYPGSDSTHLESNPFVTSLEYSKAMLGVPSLKRDSNKSFKQSLEKIIFPLANKRFRILLVAESYERASVQTIISNLFDLGSEVHTFVKKSRNMQDSLANTKGTSESRTKGTSKSDTKGRSTSYAEGESDSEANTQGSSRRGLLSSVLGIGVIGGGAYVGASIGSIVGGAGGAMSGVSMGASMGGLMGSVVCGVGGGLLGSFAGTFSGGIAGVGVGAILSNLLNTTTNKSTTNTKTTSKTRTNSTSKSHAISTNESQTLSTNDAKTATITLGVTYDELNKSAEYCEKVVEKYVERFQKGLNHGMWNVALYIQSDEKSTLSQVEHILKSVYSGDESYYEAIRFSDVFTSKACDVKKLPMLYAKEYENPIHTSFSGFSTALNTEELSLLAALPHKDIQGVQVSQHTSFGLTQNISSDDEVGENITIGNILHRGEKTQQRFKISFDTLNHHLFVSGITGSGKSNSIKGILTRLQGQIPFLVIEPAKSEYKNLKSQVENLQIFSPGNSDDILRLNPFVFEKQNELTSHVDTLKATFVAAFPMEGPMPYVLESALHRVYIDKGWDFKSESHPLFIEGKFADYNQQSLLFPTMEDLYRVVDSVVAESGYAEELDSNLKAALKTRIKNLTLGVKGKIYNTRHCFSNKILFEMPTIIELSHIADDCEKSFLMGILLNKLYQYRQQQGDSNNNLRHICVIEEAHRLLPNISLESKSDEQNAKGAAVQVFINMLAEIRAYGEGLVIADQIASKLHRDVIKNTGTKIVHRTMDKEDREIIGHSMNLNEEQILDIATLKAGQAIVHNAQVHEAFMVGMDKVTCDMAQKDEIKRFYEEFLESHKIYAYEYLFEKKYKLPISKEILIFIKNEPVIKRKRLLLALFKDILLDRPLSDIKESYNKMSAIFKDFIYNNAESGVKEELDSKDLGKASCYLFMETFREFDFLSNMTYFDSIKIYERIIKAFCDFMLANNDEKYTNACNDIREYFSHKNLKRRLLSMKYYNKNDVDYTLLLEETMQVMNCYGACQEILADEEKDKLDRIIEVLKKIGFNVNDRLLQHCIFAIHCKEDENNFFNLYN